MGKRRKTLKEKKISDLRQLTTPTTSEPIKEHQQSPAGFSYSFSGTAHALHQSSFNLKRELWKTFSVSLGIVLFQFVLFLLLVNHVIKIPFGSLQY